MIFVDLYITTENVMVSSFDPRIKLRHLNAFLETVRQNGVARAGTELGMTQPAVSKAIAELEAILDVALFDRSRRALSLTAYGEMFERFAQAGTRHSASGGRDHRGGADRHEVHRLRGAAYRRGRGGAARPAALCADVFRVPRASRERAEPLSARIARELPPSSSSLAAWRSRRRWKDFPLSIFTQTSWRWSFALAIRLPR